MKIACIFEVRRTVRTCQAWHATQVANSPERRAEQSLCFFIPRSPASACQAVAGTPGPPQPLRRAPLARQSRSSRRFLSVRLWCAQRRALAVARARGRAAVAPCRRRRRCRVRRWSRRALRRRAASWTPMGGRRPVGWARRRARARRCHSAPGCRHSRRARAAGASLGSRQRPVPALLARRRCPTRAARRAASVWTRTTDRRSRCRGRSSRARRRRPRRRSRLARIPRAAVASCPVRPAGCRAPYRYRVLSGARLRR